MKHAPLAAALAAWLVAMAPALALASDAHGFEITIHGFYIIDFLAFIAILFYFGRKPIAAMLHKRHQAVAKDIEEARKLREEAAARLSEYRHRLANLEGELKESLAQIRADAELECERIVADAHKRADRLTAETETRLQQEAKKLREQLLREAAEVAVKLAVEVSRAEMTPDKHAHLVDNAVFEIGQLSSGAAGKEGAHRG